MFRHLAHFTGLSRLRVSCTRGAAGPKDVACIARLTGLTSLGFEPEKPAGDQADLRALLALTRLASVDFMDSMPGASVLPSLNLEALQNLRMFFPKGDLSVLQRATRLTCLELSSMFSEGDECLGPTLARLTGLRSLSLHLLEFDTWKFHCTPVLRALTDLTSLEYHGSFTEETDMDACASLRGLRTLKLGCRDITPASLPALQAMSGLTKLSLISTCIQPEDLTREVRAAFDVERVRRGWPPLMLGCSSY
jgi:hypothetical protein